MKIFLSLLTCLILAGYNSYGQCHSAVCPNSTFPSPATYERALYVNDFLKLTGQNVNFAMSILGDPTDETNLLDYCVNNHFDLIYLYDFDVVYSNFLNFYNNNSNNPTYAALFKSFLINAHARGLTVGVAVSTKDLIKPIYWWNGSRERWRCTSIVSDPNTAYNSVLSELSTVPEDYCSPYLEEMKQLLQVYNFNKYFVPTENKIDFTYKMSTCDPTIAIDRIITEYEFWGHVDANHHVLYQDNTDDYNDNYKDILAIAACLNSEGPCYYKLDTYLGWLNLDYVTDLDQAQYIDDLCNRVYVHSYRCDAADLANYFVGPVGSSRIGLFGNPATKSNSEVWPIFSNEKASWFNSSHPKLNIDDYLGGYLTDASVNYNPTGGYTMACAESEFFQDFPSTGYSGLDNNVNGVLWFTYTNIVNHHILRTANAIEDNIQSSIIFNKSESWMHISSPDEFYVYIYDNLGKTIYINRFLNEAEIPSTVLAKNLNIIRIYTNKENKIYKLVNDK